ncbi:MAG: prepilin-type N-terminal cleavage/methylation domain-containing protein [Massilia sp.]
MRAVRTSAARRGFTLIELLVAISILAIVAVLGWRGLDGIVRARIALTAEVEATRGMQLAFAQMQSDVEHMADATLLQNRPFLLCDTDRMVMVRNVYHEHEASTLQVVSYRVVDNVLQRRETASTRDLMQLDMLWKAATSNSDSTVPVVLQNGVSGMVVEVWQNSRWNPGVQSASNPTALSLPPMGVQVSLQVKGVQAVMIKSFLLGGL